MNMAEYIQTLETYVASRKMNLGDGESLVSLLYEAYGDVNRIDDDQIKADFGELYRLLNGMDLCMGFWWACDCHRKYRVQNNLYMQCLNPIKRSRSFRYH